MPHFIYTESNKFFYNSTEDQPSAPLQKNSKFSAVFANRLNRKSLPNAKTLTNPLQGILEGKEWLAHAAANSTNLFFRGISKPSFFYYGVAG